MSAAVTATTGQAILWAILQDPDSDVDRLVYADWLEENGQEARGQFIRVQCELARLGSACDGYYCDESVGHIDCRGERLRRQEQALLSREQDRLRDEWCSWADLGDNPWWDAWTFSRGFVALVQLPLTDFTRHAEALFRTQPIERVVLTDQSPLENACAAQMNTWVHHGRRLAGLANASGTPRVV